MADRRTVHIVSKRRWHLKTIVTDCKRIVRRSGELNHISLLKDSERDLWVERQYMHVTDPYVEYCWPCQLAYIMPEDTNRGVILYSAA